MVKTVLAAMTLTFFAGGAAASDRPVRPGDRVRVTVEGEREVVNVRYLRNGSFAALADGGRRPVEYSFSEIDLLERRVTRSPGMGLLHGAGVGLLAGAITGAVAGVVIGADTGGVIDFTAGEGGVIGAFLVGGAGLAVGSVLGLLFPGHTWHAVDIGDSPEVSFDIGEGARIGLAISF